MTALTPEGGASGRAPEDSPLAQPLRPGAAPFPPSPEAVCRCRGGKGPAAQSRSLRRAAPRWPAPGRSPFSLPPAVRRTHPPQRSGPVAPRRPERGGEEGSA